METNGFSMEKFSRQEISASKTELSVEKILTSLEFTFSSCAQQVYVQQYLRQISIKMHAKFRSVVVIWDSTFPFPWIYQLRVTWNTWIYQGVVQETSWDSWRIIWKTIQGKCHGGFEKDKLSLNIISNISVLFRTDNTNIIHVTI